MAFWFTVLFIVTAYITPQVLFGALAEYRIEVILAALAVVTSIPNILRARFAQSPQFYVFLAFCVAVPMSILASGYVGGAADALYGFLPVVLCFVLPAANFRTRQQLQWITLAMLLCSSYFIYNGLQDLQNHVIPSNFLYGDGDLRRLRGLGFVFDPNDLSQVLVSLLPMVFLWKSKNRFLNVFLLGIPIALLVTGMFFTHSRGAALALMATLILALRRKIGTVPSVVLAGALFAASLAVGWSGGREVSVEAGGDRLDAWSTGIEFIKQHPVFGVGVGRFSEFNEITAHNSVVVCAAEIGLPGFACWVFLMFSALRKGVGINRKPAEQEEEQPAETTLLPRVGPFSSVRPRPLAAAALAGPPMHLRSMALAGAPARFSPAAGGAVPIPAAAVRGAANATAEQQENIRRMARLLICSLAGFLVAGWFLSRAMSMWLFFYIGTMYALEQMAEDAGMQVRKDSFSFLLRWSVAVSAILLLMVYGVLKFRALTGR